jgi:glycosyltransferase involved in cell wall biosynthesis
MKVEKPLFLDMSDSISEHYKNAVKVTSSPFWKLIYSFEGKRMRSYEEKYLNHFKKVFLFNPLEINLYDRGNMRWIPHGVNQKIIDYKLTCDLKRNNKISFLGKMDYRPNVEAVKWFVANVLPHVNERYTFQIIGAYPSKEVLQLKGPRVEVTGFVDDPYLLLKESLCVVAPMVSGGGIQNKLLESMSIGCVNVVSSICARPLINVKDEILVEDDPQKMAQIINQLNPESDVYKHYEESSRIYITNNYTWEKFEEVLFHELDL